MKLAELLRADTSAVHQQAEDSQFVRELLAGRIGLAAYLGMLRGMHVIYQSLEQQLGLSAADPALAAIADSRLARTGAIAEDLAELAGPNWQTLAVEPAAAQYVRRLEEIGKSEPTLLVAHAYVRYLGDLSGGQLIQRSVAPTLGRHAASAIRFYQFGDVSQVRELKSRFRDGLNRITADPKPILKEALYAFAMHQLLFKQLAITFLSESGDPLEKLADA